MLAPRRADATPPSCSTLVRADDAATRSSEAFLAPTGAAIASTASMATATSSRRRTDAPVVARRLDAPHDRRGGASRRLSSHCREPPRDERRRRRNRRWSSTTASAASPPRGDEYVIRLRPDADGRLRLPPLPWTPRRRQSAGRLHRHRNRRRLHVDGQQPREPAHALANDPVSDPHSEAIYLRDRDRQAFWSPTPGPAGPNVVHEVRYGFGYAQYEQTSAELRQRVLQVRAAATIRSRSCDCRSTNLSRRPRRLDVFFYAHLALGNGVAGAVASSSHMVRRREPARVSP